jgi:ABC-type Mn2+/Zn2+ transport system ATPase subunit
MPEPIIRIEDAVVAYRDVVALGSITLSINRNEFVAIVGPNGAGKTTLLTVINGLTRLTKGRINILGSSIAGHRRHDLRKRVGYVAQAEPVDRRMPLSVRDAVIVGRYGVIGLFRHPTVADWNKVDSALEMVGVSHLAGRPVGHLSGGEQQRVAIARCLVQEPEILLLDEPTASLDWKARTEIIGLVKTIHERQYLTTLFVTHDLDALPHTCDRVVLMKNGRLIDDGAPDKVFSVPRLSQLYGLPEHIIAERLPHVHREQH